MPESKPKLEERVIRAAEAALADHQYASVIDVLEGDGWLPSSVEQEWRRGRIEILLEAIQVGGAKLGSAVQIFREWALAKGLLPSETRYVRASRQGSVDLRFSIEADSEIENIFRTH